jgi:hypothetical protein
MMSPYEKFYDVEPQVQDEDVLAMMRIAAV